MGAPSFSPYRVQDRSLRLTAHGQLPDDAAFAPESEPQRTIHEMISLTEPQQNAAGD
jgi:hypothetical protein